MKIRLLDNPYPPWEHRECHSCRKSLPIEKLFMLSISSNTLLCPDCVATLHSMTSPLSILVMTGIDTKKDE